MKLQQMRMELYKNSQ